MDIWRGKYFLIRDEDKPPLWKKTVISPLRNRPQSLTFHSSNFIMKIDASTFFSLSVTDC